VDIFLGIDGTGPDSDATYEKAFAQSHVRKLWAQWHTPCRKYDRGPTMLGTESETLAARGTLWVHEQYTRQIALARKGDLAASARPRVFLSGYSRGGAAVVEAAHTLSRLKIPVHCMLLFDAVDRSFLENTDVVPANVTIAYHAMRDPAAGSREMFGSCATRHARKSAMVRQHFFCTHGGVGGCPWPKNGKSGKIEEMTTAEKAKLVGAGAVFGLGFGAAAAKAYADRNDFTNVTAAQDKAGAASSWAWMTKNLKTALASGLDHKIGSVGDYNHADIIPNKLAQGGL